MLLKRWEYFFFLYLFLMPNKFILLASNNYEDNYLNISILCIVSDNGHCNIVAAHIIDRIEKELSTSQKNKLKVNDNCDLIISSSESAMMCFPCTNQENKATYTNFYEKFLEKKEDSKELEKYIQECFEDKKITEINSKIFIPTFCKIVKEYYFINNFFEGFDDFYLRDLAKVLVSKKEQTLKPLGKEISKNLVNDYDSGFISHAFLRYKEYLSKSISKPPHFNILSINIWETLPSNKFKKKKKIKLLTYKKKYEIDINNLTLFIGDEGTVLPVGYDLEETKKDINFYENHADYCWNGNLVEKILPFISTLKNEISIRKGIDYNPDIISCNYNEIKYYKEKKLILKNIKDEDIKNIFELIQMNKKIKILDLSNNEIGKNANIRIGFDPIINFFKSGASLKELYLNGNSISDNHLNYLRIHLKKIKKINLQSLYLKNIKGLSHNSLTKLADMSYNLKNGFIIYLSSKDFIKKIEEDLKCHPKISFKKIKVEKKLDD